MHHFPTIILAALAAICSACTSLEVDKFDVAHHEVRRGDQMVPGEHIPGITYKVIEMTKVNAFAPGYAFHVLYRCDQEGQSCHEIAQQPVTFPGLAPAFFNAAIQGAAIGYAGHEVGKGLGQSGSQTTVHGANANAAGGSSSSTAVSGSSSSSSVGNVGGHGR